MSEVVIVLLAGGAPGSLQDKIYVSSETEVRGFSKKGKQFLSFDTNLTEPIQSMYAPLHITTFDTLIYIYIYYGRFSCTLHCMEHVIGSQFQNREHAINFLKVIGTLIYTV